MLARLRRRLSYANVMATLAFFLALSTGGAYAANTIFSTDIVDGQVKTADLANLGVTSPKLGTGSVTNAKLGTNAVTSSKLLDGQVFTNDLANGAVTSAKIADSNVGSADVSNNSLTGTDINESTLVGVNDGNSCGNSGAALFDRLCAGSDGVDRDVFAAGAFCASIGLRLPDSGEAYLLAKNHDVPGVDPPDVTIPMFWTADNVGPNPAGSAFLNVAFSEDGEQIFRAWGDDIETVCVTNPD